MNKKIIMIVALLMLITTAVSASSLNGNYKGNPIVKITSNGIPLEVDEVPPMIYDGHTVVPISLLRQLGASVTWDQNTYGVDVKLPSNNSLLNKPTIDEISTRFGSKGLNYAYLVEYNNFDGAFSQIVFHLHGSTVDPTKKSEYNEMFKYAINIGADQIKIIDPVYETFIFMKDYLDFNNGDITVDQYSSKIIVRNIKETFQQPTTTVVPSTPATGVIESKIDGDFEGFDSDKLFKLQNGQIWQQTDYTYKYTYKYSPKVTIYKDGISYYMIVDGVEKKVKVIQLK